MDVSPLPPEPPNPEPPSNPAEEGQKKAGVEVEQGRAVEGSAVKWGPPFWTVILGSVFAGIRMILWGILIVACVALLDYSPPIEDLKEVWAQTETVFNVIIAACAWGILFELGVFVGFCLRFRCIIIAGIVILCVDFIFFVGILIPAGIFAHKGHEIIDLWDKEFRDDIPPLWELPLALGLISGSQLAGIIVAGITLCLWR